MSWKTIAFCTFVLAGGSSAMAQAACDRTCLNSTLNDYLAAVVAHKPTDVKWAPGSRETQNAVETPAGKGIWTTATAVGPGRRYADPVSGEVGFFGTIEEGAAGRAIVGVRLKVKDSAVAESEWILARKGMAFYQPDAFEANLPRANRPAGTAALERDAALAVANSYFEGIDESNGDLVKAAPECFRIENGTQTVGRTPNQPKRTADSPRGDGIASALAAGITSCPSGFADLKTLTEDVIDRRFFYDPEAGLVWSHGTFKRVPGGKDRNGKMLPWLNFFELFEIDDGRIRGIYAAMNFLPKELTSSGWGGAEE
jgi:hypothetical protein